jgi:NADPH-dependent 2,4-dienoyl-CoA reductase/sulfur reductase-like enzyme
VGRIANPSYNQIGDLLFDSLGVKDTNAMRRRDLIKAASAGLGGLAIGPETVCAGEGPAALADEVDVLVVGGGTAGAVAAIQAGRAGARTMLVEMGSQLGGTTTTGGVAFPGLFHAWGKQIVDRLHGRGRRGRHARTAAAPRARGDRSVVRRGRSRTAPQFCAAAAIARIIHQPVG